eukprot:1303614-Amphidinium_carterae.1
MQITKATCRSRDGYKTSQRDVDHETDHETGIRKAHTEETRTKPFDSVSSGKTAIYKAPYGEMQQLGL